MGYTDERLTLIYDKTDGCCHICYKKLSFSNYGIMGGKGNWEVEHSVARANGGTDHLNNLFAACIKCNRDKGTQHTKTARGWHGNKRAPYSKARKEQIKENNTIAGAVVGGAIGTIFGPGGTLLGTIIGGVIGNSNSSAK